MAECEDLELQRRPAPEGSEKRGQKSGQQVPEGESKEKGQLPVYQSDRILREPQVALLAALLAQSAAMAQSPNRIDVSKLGPQVGEHVPDFTLKDQNGKTWTLQAIMRPKGAMLVFYRSADW
jgi:hypothetical protein